MSNRYKVIEFEKFPYRTAVKGLKIGFSKSLGYSSITDNRFIGPFYLLFNVNVLVFRRLYTLRIRYKKFNELKIKIENHEI